MLTEEQTVKYVFDNIRFCSSLRELKRSGDRKAYYSSLDRASFRLFYFTAVIFCAISAFSAARFEGAGRICMPALSGITAAAAAVGIFITFGRFNAKKYYFNTVLSSFCMTVAMILTEWAFAVNLKPSPLLSLPFVMIPAAAVFLFRDLFLKRAGAEFSRMQRIARLILYPAAILSAAAVMIYCFASAQNRDPAALCCTLLTVALSAAPSVLLSDIFKLYRLINLERSGFNTEKYDALFSSSVKN